MKNRVMLLLIFVGDLVSFGFTFAMHPQQSAAPTVLRNIYDEIKSAYLYVYNPKAMPKTPVFYSSYGASNRITELSEVRRWQSDALGRLKPVQYAGERGKQATINYPMVEGECVYLHLLPLADPAIAAWCIATDPYYINVYKMIMDTGKADFVARYVRVPRFDAIVRERGVLDLSSPDTGQLLPKMP